MGNLNFRKRYKQSAMAGLVFAAVPRVRRSLRGAYNAELVRASNASIEGRWPLAVAAW